LNKGFKAVVCLVLIDERFYFCAFLCCNRNTKGTLNDINDIQVVQQIQETN
jgi:hypothetical protein